MAEWHELYTSESLLKNHFNKKFNKLNIEVQPVYGKIGRKLMLIASVFKEYLFTDLARNDA